MKALNAYTRGSCIIPHSVIPKVFYPFSPFRPKCITWEPGNARVFTIASPLWECSVNYINTDGATLHRQVLITIIIPSL